MSTPKYPRDDHPTEQPEARSGRHLLIHHRSRTPLHRLVRQRMEMARLPPRTRPYRKPRMPLQSHLERLATKDTSTVMQYVVIGILAVVVVTLIVIGTN
jgi:hypothetical protein